MTSDSVRLCDDIGELARRLAARITPKLPSMVAARLLVGLDACHGDLQRLLDTVDGALQSVEPLSDK